MIAVIRMTKIFNCFNVFHSTPCVSIITISNKILSFYGFKDQIDSAFNQPNLKAVCLKINSPGGSTVQCHLIAEYIKSQEEKYQVPVLAFVEDKALSGGYLVACAASVILVSRSSTFGSISVTQNSFSVTKLLHMLDIERNVDTAGSQNGGLNPLTQTTKDELFIRNLLGKVVHQEFIQFVKDSREDRLVLEESEVLFSGAAFGALDAIKLGLVDGLYTVLKDEVSRLIGEKKFKLIEITAWRGKSFKDQSNNFLVNFYKGYFSIMSSEKQPEGVRDGPVEDSAGAPGGAGAGQDPNNVAELTHYIQSMLQQLQDRFQTMSEQLISRIDDMGERLDDLEHNINYLMSQAGETGPPMIDKEQNENF